MLLDPQIVVLDAFCGIKNTQESISDGALPRTPLVELTQLSHIL